MILDSSALLAIGFGEPLAEVLIEAMVGSEVLLLSAGNLAETVMTSARRNPARHEETLARIRDIEFEVVPLNADMAYSAAEAKVRFPVLNLGDTFCYALAHSRGLPILTIDADFLKTDASLVPLGGE